MNSFSGWFLSPQFNITLDPVVMPRDDKESHTENISIHLLMEEELKSYSSIDNKKLLHMNSSYMPKKLSFQEPGKAHIASNIGCIFSTQLIPFIKENKPIFITISESLKKLIKNVF